MHIAWGSLGIVFTVSFAAAVAVVTLVALALVSFSPKPSTNYDNGVTTTTASASGKAIGGLCLATASLIVAFGLYMIVAA